MKVKIVRRVKNVHIESSSIRDAGWFGFIFAKNHADLIVDKWALYFYEKGNAFFGALPECTETISHPAQLAERILSFSCCNNCGCSKGQ